VTANYSVTIITLFQRKIHMFEFEVDDVLDVSAPKGILSSLIRRKDYQDTVKRLVIGGKVVSGHITRSDFLSIPCDNGDFIRLPIRGLGTFKTPSLDRAEAGENCDIELLTTEQQLRCCLRAMRGTILTSNRHA
jgi:hypothetical protein